MRTKFTPLFFYLILGCAALSTQLSAEEPNHTTLTTLLLGMMPNHPKLCFGIETVPGLNETILDRDSITKAQTNYKSLSKVAAEQTDYTVEVTENTVLISPKLAPQAHEGPVVDLLVNLASSPEDWKSLEDALKAISFVEKPTEFAPFLLVTSKTYPADHPLQIEAIPEPEREKLAPSKTIKLSDALFLIARMANATTWSYQSHDGMIINGQRKPPKRLNGSVISFSGPAR